MSGFVSVINTDGEPVDRDLLRRLTDSLEYRGPDHRDIWIDDSVGFGHALFKTSNEAEYEHQPGNLDAECWITSSARIDAREELVTSLGLQDRIKLNQTPDSDLVLYAYRRWQEQCTSHLLGDFSFVIWDKQQNKLFCARDRFGMRQFYYAQLNNTLIISNSMYCMLQHPGISRQLNDHAIAGFLLIGDHEWFDTSITTFADIQTLPPAHSLVLNNGRLSIQRYWDLPEEVPLLSYKHGSEYLEHFRSVFKTAVADRLRSPEIIVSMSGGLDSTSIASAVKELHNNSGNPAVNLNAVTIVYKSIHPDDEQFYAGLTADALGIPIHYVDASCFPMLGVSLMTTRPFANYQPELWRELCRVHSGLGRIMLAGRAADNLLKFTPLLSMDWKEINLIKLILNLFYLYKKYKQIPGPGTGLLGRFWHGGGLTKGKLAYPYPCWINKEFETRMQMEEHWNEFFSRQFMSCQSRHPMIYKSLMQATWNTDDLLMHTERALPEECDPFLDIRLIEFILSLPPLPWLFNKHILREAMTEKLPKEVVERPKKPIGYVHDSLIGDTSKEEIDEWEPVPELHQYTKRDNIPRLNNGRYKGDDSDLHLRPLFLNRWLQDLSNLK